MPDTAQVCGCKGLGAQGEFEFNRLMVILVESDYFPSTGVDLVLRLYIGASTFRCGAETMWNSLFYYVWSPPGEGFASRVWSKDQQCYYTWRTGALTDGRCASTGRCAYSLAYIDIMRRWALEGPGWCAPPQATGRSVCASPSHYENRGMRVD